MTAIRRALEHAAEVQAALRADVECMAACDAFVAAALATFRRGGTIWCCGNGGSMSDAMHFAEEWTGRLCGRRRAAARRSDVSASEQLPQGPMRPVGRHGLHQVC